MFFDLYGVKVSGVGMWALAVEVAAETVEGAGYGASGCEVFWVDSLELVCVV